MTTERPPIEALEATLAKATDAPWTFTAGELDNGDGDDPERQVTGAFITEAFTIDLEEFYGMDNANAEAIVALRNAAPDLFAWIRLLESRGNQAVCSFCGEITVNDIEHLSAHVAACEKHPVRKLLLEKKVLEARLAAVERK